MKVAVRTFCGEKRLYNFDAKTMPLEEIATLIKEEVPIAKTVLIEVPKEVKNAQS